jgi:hypothetical protein
VKGGIGVSQVATAALLHCFIKMTLTCNVNNRLNPDKKR